MKKLMTSTIIILPLILLAILLVSGAILSFSVHIYVETVELSNKDTIILVMDNESNVPTYNLGNEVTILPIKATNQKLNYTSENENVVTIDNNGIIHANFYGETYVTVTSKENLAASATRKVIVTDDKVHAVKINEQISDLYQDEKISLTANIYPKEAENKGLKWTSSNPAILNVSANGTITAIGSGIAKVIAASVENESVFAELEINCHKKLTDITFNTTDVQTTQEIIEFPEVTPLPNDINTDDITYSYSSNNMEVAGVDKFGKIKFLKPGSVVISVTASDFKGETVTKQKTFTSTMGYFTKPIFAQEEISWSDCHSGEDLASTLLNNQLEGTCKGIASIVCLRDGITPVNDVIKFENNKFVFGNNLDCDAFIEVTINAKIFNFDSNTLEDYAETIKINKTPYQSGVNAIVKLNGGTLTKDEINNISINNLNEQIVLQISNSDATPKISSNTYVDVDIAGNKITITGKASCENIDMDLSIGVSKYKLKITIKAQADIVEVSCGGAKLHNLESYNTLLDTLTFDVKLNRTDGKTVTDNTIQYSLNNGGEFVTTQVSQLEINTSSNRTIKIKSGTAEFSFEINKKTLNDFGIKVIASNATLATINSVKDTTEYQCRIPSDVLDQITLQIIIDEELLGGLGDNDATFEEMFDVNLFGLEGWIASFSAINQQITLEFSGKQEFNNKIAISYKELSTTLQFVRVNLTLIEFDGFDISNKKDDVYLGYQQVRVFAKHSYYNGAVDYFKIPFKAISSLITQKPANPEIISWTLTRVDDNKNEKQIITTQSGYEVIFNGTNYTITKDGDNYVLKDANGNVVVGADGKNSSGIIWVDVFSEPGYARIYFGNFAGLAESDVQNSYFGNFANEEHWVKPSIAEKDDTNRIVAPSQNAFTFLQVMAGDSAVGGINRYYNFNVLDDDELINIFDAKGYYNNDKLVLHTDLYGPGEIEKPDQNKVLTSPKNVSKTIVYGNGYHINLEARNQELIDDAYSKKETDNGVAVSKLGWHNGASFERIYNLTLMGANPATEIIRTKQCMVFRIGYAYYSNIQYLSKINTFYDDAVPDTGNGGNNRDEKGSYSYIKNSVIRYAAWACFQCSFPNDKAYFENVVFAESNIAITFENKRNMTCYFKGFNDILSYRTAPELCKAIGQQEGIGTEVIQNADKFAEWFGKTNSGLGDILVAVKERYVNAAVANCVAFDYTNQVLFWNGKNYGSQNGAFADKITILELYRVWLYDRTVEFDGGQKVGRYYSDRDMSKLFDNPNAVRLLCQYKTPTEKNTDHILWHIQQVYRNPNLIEGRETNHIEHLKSTLKDVVWPDGSTANEAISLSESKIISNNLLVILPNKKRQLF